MRALSHRQAQRCEDAEHPKCTCRCGGQFHGGKRGDVTTLPLDDPHSPSRICPKCHGTGKRHYVDLITSGQAAEWTCEKCQGSGRVLAKSAKR